MAHVRRRERGAPPRPHRRHEHHQGQGGSGQCRSAGRTAGRGGGGPPGRALAVAGGPHHRRCLQGTGSGGATSDDGEDGIARRTERRLRANQSGSRAGRGRPPPGRPRSTIPAPPPLCRWRCGTALPLHARRGGGGVRHRPGLGRPALSYGPGRRHARARRGLPGRRPSGLGPSIVRAHRYGGARQPARRRASPPRAGRVGGARCACGRSWKASTTQPGQGDRAHRLGRPDPRVADRRRDLRDQRTWPWRCRPFGR